MGVWAQTGHPGGKWELTVCANSERHTIKGPSDPSSCSHLSALFSIFYREYLFVFLSRLTFPFTALWPHLTHYHLIKADMLNVSVDCCLWTHGIISSHFELLFLFTNIHSPFSSARSLSTLGGNILHFVQIASCYLCLPLMHQTDCQPLVSICGPSFYSVSPSIGTLLAALWLIERVESAVTYS